MAPLRSRRAKRSWVPLSAWLSLALLSGCAKIPDLTLTLQLRTGAAAPSSADLAAARKTVYDRLGQLGVLPAIVETAGSDRITVKIAREDDSERVRRILLMSSIFELRLVRFPKADGSNPKSPEELLGHFGGQLPPELELLTEVARGQEGTTPAKRIYAVERQPLLTARDIASAKVGRGQFADPIVEFTVKPEPARTFAQATGDNVGSFLAIVLDGHVLSAPRINAKIGESGVIEGGFTQEQAEDLAVLLRSGPLPGQLTFIEEREEGGGR